MSTTFHVAYRRRTIGGTRTVTPGQLNGCVSRTFSLVLDILKGALTYHHLTLPTHSVFLFRHALRSHSHHDNIEPTVQIKSPRPLDRKRGTFGRDHYRRRGRGGCRSGAEEGKVSPRGIINSGLISKSSRFTLLGGACVVLQDFDDL
jgi:hypothetical protein